MSPQLYITKTTTTRARHLTPTHSLQVVFDIMAFMIELKEATSFNGSAKPASSFNICSNTLLVARKPSADPRFLIQAAPPYTVCEVNGAFCKMFGYSFEEVLWKWDVDCVCGSGDDNNAPMKESLALSHPLTQMVRRKRKSGEEFHCFIQIVPLSNDSAKTSHFLGMCEEVTVDPAALEVVRGGVGTPGQGGKFPPFMGPGGRQQPQQPPIAANPEFAKQIMMMTNGPEQTQQGKGGQHLQQQRPSMPLPAVAGYGMYPGIQGHPQQMAMRPHQMYHPPGRPVHSAMYYQDPPQQQVSACVHPGNKIVCTWKYDVKRRLAIAFSSLLLSLR